MTRSPRRGGKRDCSPDQSRQTSALLRRRGGRTVALALLFGQALSNVTPMTSLSPSPHPARRSRLRAARPLIVALAALLALYGGAAYELAPAYWRHYERQPALAAKPMTTATALGLAGDALNVGLEASRDDLICAMRAAGWRPADPITWRSSVKIAGSVLLSRAYPTAPVSDLFYEGRRQDLAFEKAVGASPRERHHVRFWQVLDAGADGRPLWLGAATFDRSVGVSHYTGQITHHVAPDIDAERDQLAGDLKAAGMVEASYSVSGVGPTVFARNGGGDPYFTDGEVAVERLAVGCQAVAAPPTLPAPPAVAAKNRLFGWLKALWRAL